MTMNKLKLALISFPALKELDYSIELFNEKVKQIEKIIVVCNMSEEECETALIQTKLEDKECHSVQFESLFDHQLKRAMMLINKSVM